MKRKHRGLRRAKQAQIRAQLLRDYTARQVKWRNLNWGESLTLTRAELRGLFRNEGKSRVRLYACGDAFCSYCSGNATYYARREQERIAQEMRAWQRGEDVMLPVTDEELQATSMRAKGSLSHSKSRRDPKRCPVCMMRLVYNAKRTHLVGYCVMCRAMPSSVRICPRCHMCAIWNNGMYAGCRACAWHGRKTATLQNV